MQNTNGVLKHSLFWMCAIFIFSGFVLIQNQLFYHFHGMDYFMFHLKNHSKLILYSVGISLFIVWIYRHKLPIYQLWIEFLWFLLIYASIFLITYAAQFTPFEPIDTWLIHGENLMHIDVVSIVTWTQMHPVFKSLLEWCYGFLNIELFLVVLLMLLLEKWHRLRAYLFMMLLGAFIGFVIYYFFPTTGPASQLNSPFFTKEQYAVALKFIQIHSYQPNVTLAAGMVAFPSFHTICSLLLLYLVFELRKLFIILLPINSLIITSTILLGWHYLVDILCSFIIFFVCYCYYKNISNDDSHA